MSPKHFMNFNKLLYHVQFIPFEQLRSLEIFSKPASLNQVRQTGVCENLQLGNTFCQNHWWSCWYSWSPAPPAPSGPPDLLVSWSYWSYWSPDLLVSRSSYVLIPDGVKCGATIYLFIFFLYEIYFSERKLKTKIKKRREIRQHPAPSAGTLWA